MTDFRWKCALRLQDGRKVYLSTTAGVIDLCTDAKRFEFEMLLEFICETAFTKDLRHYGPVAELVALGIPDAYIVRVVSAEFEPWDDPLDFTAFTQDGPVTNATRIATQGES